MCQNGTALIADSTLLIGCPGARFHPRLCPARGAENRHSQTKQIFFLALFLGLTGKF
jgi:hypothetical protein